MPLPSDTTVDAEMVQRQLLREKSPTERVMLALRLSSEVIRASKRAIARTHPEFTAEQISHRFIQLHYGPELADAVKQHSRTSGNG